MAFCLHVAQEDFEDVLTRLKQKWKATEKSKVWPSCIICCHSCKTCKGVVRHFLKCYKSTQPHICGKCGMRFTAKSDEKRHRTSGHSLEVMRKRRNKTSQLLEEELSKMATTQSSSDGDQSDETMASESRNEAPADDDDDDDYEVDDDQMSVEEAEGELLTSDETSQDGRRSPPRVRGVSGVASSQEDGTLQAETPVEDGTLQAETPVEDGTLQAETPVEDGTLQTETPVEDGTLQAETPVEDGTLQAETPVEDGTLQAETPVEDGTLQAETTVEDGTLQAETPVEDGPLQAETPVEDGPLQAETPVEDGTLQAETSVEDGTLQAETPVEETDEDRCVVAIVEEEEEEDVDVEGGDVEEETKPESSVLSSEDTKLKEASSCLEDCQSEDTVAFPSRLPRRQRRQSSRHRAAVLGAAAGGGGSGGDVPPTSVVMVTSKCSREEAGCEEDMDVDVVHTDHEGSPPLERERLLSNCLALGSSPSVPVAPAPANIWSETILSEQVSFEDSTFAVVPTESLQLDGISRRLRQRQPTGDSRARRKGRYYCPNTEFCSFSVESRKCILYHAVKCLGGVVAWACPACHRGYSTRYGLTKHLKKAHPKVHIINKCLDGKLSLPMNSQLRSYPRSQHDRRPGFLNRLATAIVAGPASPHSSPVAALSHSRSPVGESPPPRGSPSPPPASPMVTPPASPRSPTPPRMSPTTPPSSPSFQLLLPWQPSTPPTSSSSTPHSVHWSPSNPAASSVPHPPTASCSSRDHIKACAGHVMSDHTYSRGSPLFGGGRPVVGSGPVGRTAATPSSTFLTAVVRSGGAVPRFGGFPSLVPPVVTDSPLLQLQRKRRSFLSPSFLHSGFVAPPPAPAPPSPKRRKRRRSRDPFALGNLVPSGLIQPQLEVEVIDPLDHAHYDRMDRAAGAVHLVEDEYLVEDWSQRMTDVQMETFCLDGYRLDGASLLACLRGSSPLVVCSGGVGRKGRFGGGGEQLVQVDGPSSCRCGPLSEPSLLGGGGGEESVSRHASFPSSSPSKTYRTSPPHSSLALAFCSSPTLTSCSSPTLTSCFSPTSCSSPTSCFSLALTSCSLPTFCSSPTSCSSPALTSCSSPTHTSCSSPTDTSGCLDTRFRAVRRMVTGCNLLQLEVSSAWRSTSATPILQLDGNPGRRGRGRGKRGCAERVGREAVVSPAEVSSQEEETLLPLAPLPESNGEVPATLSPGLSDDQSHHLTTPPTSPTELMKRNMESYLARAVQLSNSKRVSGDSPSTASPQRLSKGKKRQPSCPQAPPPTSTTTSKAKRKKPLLSPTDVVAMDNKESELEEKKGKKKGKGKKQGKELEKEVEEVEEKEQGKKQEKKMVKKKGKGKKQGKELEKEVEEVEEKKLEKEVEEVEEKEQGKEQEKKMVKKKGKRPTKRPTKGQVEETELAAVSATATTDDTDDVQTSTEPQPSAGKAKKSAVSKKKSKKTSETDVSPVHPSAEADHGETPLVAPTDSLADLEPDLVTPEEKHPTKKAQMPSRAGQKRARKTKSSAVKPGKGRAKKAKVITPDDSNHQQEVDREQEVDQKQEVEGEEVLQEAAAPDKGATFSGKRTRRRVKKPAAATPLIETEIVPHSLPKETPEDQVYATFRRIVAKHKSICCATEGCGYRAISMNAMMYHYNRCGRDALTFTCAHCGKVYTSQAGLKYHLDKNHAEPGTKVDSTQQLLLGASGARKAAEKASSSIAEMVKQQTAPFKESERGADDPCYQETEDGNHDDKEEGEVKPRQSLQKTGDSSAGDGPSLPEPEEEEEEPRLIEEHRLDPALIAALQAGLDSGGWRRYCRVGQRPHLANKQIPLLTNQQASYLRMEVKKEKRVKCPILDCSTYLSSIQALVYHIPRCFTGTLHAAERSCSLCNDFKGTEAKLRRHLQTRHHEVASALDFDEEYKPELLDGLASSASIKWLTKTQHKGTYRKWVRWAWSTADEGFEAGVWRAQLDHWAPLEPETIEDFSGEFPPLNSTARANGIDLSSVTVGTASEVREHMIVLNTGSTILDIDWLHLPPDEVVGGATTHPSTVTKETEDSVAMETDSLVLSKDVTASAGSETVATETKTSSPVAPDSDGSGAVGCDQYLAVSTSCSLTAQDVCSRTMDQGVLQIWRVGSQGAELELCVAHRFGSVRSIKWSPSNAHTPSNGQGLERLGLLALACGDGHGRILSIPSPRQLAKGFLHKEEDPIFPLWVEPLVEQVILSTSPRASSVFNSQSNFHSKYGSCVCIDWCPSDGCSKIMAGFSSGEVIIWNLMSRSPLLVSMATESTLDVYPWRRLSAHSTVCSAVSWYPGDTSLVLTGGYDCLVHIWKIDQPSHPVVTPHLSSFSGIIRDLCWPLYNKGFFYCPEPFKGPFHALERMVLCGQKKDLVNHSIMSVAAPFNSLSYSQWGAVLAAATFEGAVRLRDCWGLNKTLNPRRKRTKDHLLQWDCLVMTDGAKDRGNLEQGGHLDGDHHGDNDQDRTIHNGQTASAIDDKLPHGDGNHDNDSDRKPGKGKGKGPKSKVKTNVSSAKKGAKGKAAQKPSSSPSNKKGSCDAYDFTLPPDLGVLKVEWNPNEGSSSWLAAATRTGHVVLMDVLFLTRPT